MMFIQLCILKLQYVLGKEALSELVNPFTNIHFRLDTLYWRGSTYREVSWKPKTADLISTARTSLLFLNPSISVEHGLG